MDLFAKGILQGSVPVIVLVGGTHYFVKKFRESKPVLYWGSLAVATGAAIGIVTGRIPAPFMKAETFDAENDDDEPLFPGLNCSHCGSDKYTFYGEPEKYAPDGKPIDPNWIEAKEHIWCEGCGMASPLDEGYDAETFEAKEKIDLSKSALKDRIREYERKYHDVSEEEVDNTYETIQGIGLIDELKQCYKAETFGAETLRVWAKDMEKDHLGHFVSKNKDGWETWKGLCGITSDKGVSRGFDVSNYDGSYGRRCRKCLTAYKKMGAETFEA